MARNKIGNAGKTRTLQFPQGPDIQGQMIPSVPLAQKAEFPGPGNGAAMAQVVVAADGEAMLIEKAGEGVVPAAVFRNTVDQLDHRPGRFFRRPLRGMDLMDPVAGGKRELPQGCHSNITSIVLQ